MLLTYKLPIWPTEEQERILWDLSEKCRLLYNFNLQECKQDWAVQQEKEKNERHYVTYQQ
jgi:putative transposase